MHMFLIELVPNSSTDSTVTRNESLIAGSWEVFGKSRHQSSGSPGLDWLASGWHKTFLSQI